jgi:hypothetical protein
MINNEWAAGLKALEKAPKRPAVHDLEEAVALVGAALDTTARQLLGPDVVFLNDDVASLLAATAAVRAKRSPLLITVTTKRLGPNSMSWASDVANHLGLDLLTAPISPEANASHPEDTALTSRALASALRGIGAKYAWGPSGADTLFDPYPNQSGPGGPVRWDWAGRRELVERACVVDAQLRRLNYDDALSRIGLRVFGFFEGLRCLAAASRLAPEVLSAHVPGTSGGEITNKAPLRALALAWGVPAELCLTEH